MPPKRKTKRVAKKKTNFAKSVFSRIQPKKRIAKKAIKKKPPTKKKIAKKATKKKPPTKKKIAKKATKKKPPTKKKIAKKATKKKPPTKKKIAKKATKKKPATKKKIAKKATKKKPPTKKKIVKKAIKKKPARKAGNIKKSPTQKIKSLTKNKITPYKKKKNNKDYMSLEQTEYFRGILLAWRGGLMQEVDRTVAHMQDDATNFPDPNDRASQEEEFTLELRTRDRERKLISKINESIAMLDSADYGFCEICGVEIGVRRLEARPTATQCIDCKTLDEIKERHLS